jgi:hypothetical protein
MAQLPVTQRRLQLPSSFQETQFSDAGVKSLQRTSDMLLKQTQAIEERASNNAYLKAQGAISKELNRLETEYGADPENLEQAITNFSDKFMENIYDPDVRGKIELQLQEKSLSAIGRATDKRNKIITDQGVYDTLLAVDGLSTEMEKIAADAFSSNPTIRAAAGKQMQEIMLRGQTILDQKGPDGMPLLSPEKRVSTLFAIRDGSFESIAKAYIQSSQNKLAAADDWINGRVSIELPNPDGTMQKINMRDAMPASARTKADGAIMGAVKEQMYIVNEYEQRVEKQQKELAERAISEITVRMQDDPNSVTIEMLDANRNLFIKGGQEKEFLTLRAAKLKGEPLVEDGSTITAMNMAVLRGQDPSEIGRAAVLNGRISWKTYKESHSYYNDSLGSAGNSFNLWRGRLKESTASQLEVRPALAAATVKADAYLVARMKEWQKNNPDKILTDEIIEPIYDETVRKFRLIPDEDGILGSIAIVPTYIPPTLLPAEKTPDNLKQTSKFVNDRFKKLYGSDKSQWPREEKLQASNYIKALGNDLKKAKGLTSNKKVD